MRAGPTATGDRVVVIGGGPCGAIAAQRLVAAGIDVVLLDSGTRAPRGLVVKVAGRTVFRWVEGRMLSVNRHAGASDPATVWYSSLSLGGLSNYWTGAVPRFADADFTEGARIDERYRWPIGLSDLRPYYEAVETLMAVTAGDPIGGVPPGRARYRWTPPEPWRTVASTASSHGFGMGPLPMAKGSPWMALARGNEFDSFHQIVKPALTSGRLQLRRGAHAVRVLSERGTATGVEYADVRTGELHTVPSVAVVVAAGPLDSTELLMRSATGDEPAGLGSTHGVVGRYLHDHPREWYALRLDTSLPALVHPLYIARGEHDASPPLLATASTLGLTGVADRLRTFSGGTVDVIGVQAFGTTIPTPDQGLSLTDRSSRTTTRSALRIDLRYDQATVENLRLGRDRVRAAFAAAGIEATAPEVTHELSPGSSVHLGGTARMHDDPRFGVVDRWNRVHGVPNVLVCDASCFTTGPEKNPTLTAMAISARAADRLAKDLASSTS